MTYRLNDAYGTLEAWRDACMDEDLRLRVEAWLFELIEDPDSVGGVLVPDYASTPLPVYGKLIPGTDVVVLWQVFTSPPWDREIECVSVCHIETTKR